MRFDKNNTFILCNKSFGLIPLVESCQGKTVILNKFNEEKLRCKFNVTFETFDDAPRSQLIFETFNYLLPETKKTLKPEKELTLMIISLRVREILKLSMSMFIS